MGRVFLGIRQMTDLGYFWGILVEARVRFA